MDRIRAYWILSEVANREGVSLKEVTAEIELAIREAIANANACNDEKRIAQWKRISPTGETPTAVELLMYLADEARHGNPEGESQEGMTALFS